MAGQIPNNFIDQLLARVDIVDVIDKRVPLKKAGSEFQACCPFHGEKTPSFTVSPKKQFYHCFGCGAHGTAIGFLMDYERLNFVEAIEELAKQVGMDVPRDNAISKGPDTSPLYAALEASQQFYLQQLRTHSDKARAVDYLKQRGLSGDIAKRFGIGFAPPGWDNLLQKLGQDFSAHTLEQAGLSNQRDNGAPYDRFRDRIMFPIRDSRGRIVGFGGRVIGDDKPKYLNSPETPIFHKGDILYGLFEARRAPQQDDFMVIVEGYMDVVALAQYGITNCVATLGTATTQRHLEQLFRATNKVVFCFDGDRAGRDAAWKALQIALPLMSAGREARFLLLPENEDPDSLVRSIGADALRQRFVEAPPLSSFLFEHIQQQIDTSMLDGRARFADAIKPYIQRLPAGSLQELLGKKLEHFTGLETKITSPPPQLRRTQPTRKMQTRTLTPVQLALRLLLEEPSLALTLKEADNWQSAPVKGVEFLMQMIEFIKKNPDTTTAGILEHWRDTSIGEHLGLLLQSRMSTPEQGLQDEFTGCFRQLANQQRKEQLQQLVNRPFSQLSDDEKIQLRQLLEHSNEKSVNSEQS